MTKKTHFQPNKCRNIKKKKDEPSPVVSACPLLQLPCSLILIPIRFSLLGLLLDILRTWSLNLPAEEKEEENNVTRSC